MLEESKEQLGHQEGNTENKNGVMLPKAQNSGASGMYLFNKSSLGASCQAVLSAPQGFCGAQDTS